MAVRRKPSTVEEFINAGGSPPVISAPTSTEIQMSPEATKLHEKEEEMIAITLRVPSDLLAELDTTARKCRTRRSRNSWILEAIIEKLEQESRKDN